MKKIHKNIIILATLFFLTNLTFSNSMAANVEVEMLNSKVRKAWFIHRKLQE